MAKQTPYRYSADAKEIIQNTHDFCKREKVWFTLDWVEALRPSQQFFSHVGTEPPHPRYYQYFLGGNCILLKDTKRRPE